MYFCKTVTKLSGWKENFKEVFFFYYSSLLLFQNMISLTFKIVTDGSKGNSVSLKIFTKCDLWGGWFKTENQLQPTGDAYLQVSARVVGVNELCVKHLDKSLAEKTWKP